MADPLKYLLAREWCEGNGQCPDCWGVNAGFLSQYAPKQIGHKPDCGHAAAILALGGKPMMLGDCQPPHPESHAAFAKRHWDETCAKLQFDFDKTFMKALLGDGSALDLCHDLSDGKEKLPPRPDQ